MKKKEIVNRLSKLINEGYVEKEGSSYKLALEEISENSMKINSMINPEDDLPSWVQDKITIANHNMEAILGYFESENIEEGEGLWANIHAKRKRGESPAKPGDEDYPDKKAWDKAKKSEEFSEELSEEEYDEACELMESLSFMNEGQKYGFYEIDTPTLNEAEYQGRTVKLGKIMRGDVKKFKVFVKNDKGNVVKVNFGQKGVKIKKNNPERRRSFRARHNCENPGPRWKARYWACKTW
jgi:hypothetical protein